MSNKLYVGNLSFDCDQASLEGEFANLGTVDSCKVIMDRDTGRSRGFAFVEMGTPEEARTCIDELDGKEFMGRNMRVSISQERQGGGGNRRGGGGGRNFRSNDRNDDRGRGSNWY